MASHLFSAVSSTLKATCVFLRLLVHFSPFSVGPCFMDHLYSHAFKFLTSKTLVEKSGRPGLSLHIRSPQAGCSSRPKASSLRTQITELLNTWLSLYVPSLLWFCLSGLLVATGDSCCLLPAHIFIYNPFIKLSSNYLMWWWHIFLVGPLIDKISYKGIFF